VECILLLAAKLHTHVRVQLMVHLLRDLTLVSYRGRSIDKFSFVIDCIELELVRWFLAIDSFFYFSISFGVLDQSVFVNK